MMFRRTALRWMGVWLMVLGVLALVVRLTASLPPYWWAYGLGSLAILLGVAWRRELKRRPNAEQLRATCHFINLHLLSVWARVGYSRN